MIHYGPASPTEMQQLETGYTLAVEPTRQKPDYLQTRWSPYTASPDWQKMAGHCPSSILLLTDGCRTTFSHTILISSFGSR